MRSKKQILYALDEVSRRLHAMSSEVMSLVDELDPDWRPKREKEREAMVRVDWP